MSGAFREGNSLYAMVPGDAGEPGPNPYENVKSDRSYSSFMEFIFLDRCVLWPEKEDGKPWLAVETLGRIQLYGTCGSLPAEITAESLGLADWVQITEDPVETDPCPHTPNRQN